MSRLSIGRSVRILRHDRGWSQAQLASAAQLSQTVISRLERDLLDGIRLGAIRRCVAALDGFVAIEVRRSGVPVSSALDARHAALQEWCANFLSRHGWRVEVEVSFNHFGDRGRCDVFAAHSRPPVLLIVEVKTSLDDLQDALGKLDVKVRNAARIANSLGWSVPTSVIPALVVENGRTAQRRVAGHAALFSRYEVRGRAAVGWLRHPREPLPSGLLMLVSAPTR